MTQILVPGQKIFSWPRWAGSGMLVACIGTGQQPDSIALLDVTLAETGPKVVETLWQRSPELDVYARWPLFSPATGTLLLRRRRGERADALLGEARRGRPGDWQWKAKDTRTSWAALAFSPDGRYLLFGANRPDRAGTPVPAAASTAAARGAPRLAEALRE